MKTLTVLTEFFETKIMKNLSGKIHLYKLKELLYFFAVIMILISIILFIQIIRVDMQIDKLRTNSNVFETSVLKILTKMSSRDSSLSHNDSILTSRINHIPTNPLDINSMTKVSSIYNYRTNPYTNKKEFHAGIDYNVPKGTAVYASADGIVIQAGLAGGYGNAIKINHENGYITQYSHLEKIEVIKGQNVKQGEIIGRVGRTGEATGSHLDFRITFMEKYINPSIFTTATN